MENTNSNKPLSAHELLNLIKLKSSEQLIDQDLDDFEKDALEGFVDHSTPDNFTKLNIDVQLGISKKVSENTFFKNRNTFIFSAAASIVLIVLISLFYVIDFNKNSSSELALNNESIQESPNHQIKDDVEKINQDEIPVKNKEAKQLIGKADGALFKTDAKKSETPVRLESSQTTKDEATRNVSNKEEVKSTETIGGATVSQSFSYIEKPQVASADMSLNEVAVENDDSKVGSTKSLSENKQEKVAITAAAKKSSIQLTAIPSTTDPKANFAGGEAGIKNYVLSYAKQSDLSEKLSGSYKIKVIIKPNGTIIVLKIKSIANGDLKSIDSIKKILNSMKNWNPEMDNGKAVQSNKEFVLEF
jgi:hypothetical protein